MNLQRSVLPLILISALCGCVGSDADENRAQELGGSYYPTKCSDLKLGTHSLKVLAADGDGVKVIDAYNTLTLSWDIYAGIASFTSTLGIDAAIVTGGYKSLVYKFDPESFGAGDLKTPLNPYYYGKRYPIKSVEFCYDYELSVSKTAKTKLTRTWEWDIAKTVYPTSHQLEVGDSATSYYKVILTKLGYTDSGYKVVGQVIVENKTPLLANIYTIIDTLSDGTPVPLTCDKVLPTTLIAGGKITCWYSVDLDAPADLINKAVVKVKYGSPVGGGSASADVDFGDATIYPVNADVSVEDDFGGEITDLGIVSETQTIRYDRTFDCELEGTNDNTATILETAQSASATVTVVCTEVGDEGCSPGYWKNHPEAWSSTGYTPGTKVVAVFANAAAYIPNTHTLMDALNYRGGPKTADKAQILLRQAVAALLDASHPGVAYPISAAQVIQRTNDALASGDKDAILELKDVLDEYNNLGCPL